MIVFWFAVAAVIFLYLQSKLFQRFGWSRLTYTRKFQKRAVFRGEQLELVEQLTNAKWLPVPWLRVESQLSSSLLFQRQDNFAVSSGQLYQNHKSFFALMPYSRITRRHRVKCLKRGLYRLDSVTLTIGDLAGFSRSARRMLLSDELVVYPAPAPVSVSELPSHGWQGETSVRRWIAEDPFVRSGTRDYRPGDTFKQINWKATARSGKLQSHQYDYTADRKLMIYLNVDDHEGMWRDVADKELIECGIEWAAGAAEAVVDEGMEVGFAANMPLAGASESVFIEPRSGGAQLYELLEAMARLELVRTERLVDLLVREADRGYTGRDVLIISTYWNEALETEARRLRGGGNEVAFWRLEAGPRSGINGDSGKDGATA
ncbi:DUF58 domain-containing protein [Paenibacillus thailandensis]|jgi:uncharacterized protein (DUF58 family)|uniref:DUF58 domain-containing protein n=1 Tax=Paenibacillus thailandensis TaxID=393250 RepID=A0ABW5QTY3_9BACL